MGWRGELNYQEQAIHRERKRHQAKRARSPDIVLAEIRENLKQQARTLGLTPEAFRSLLSEPEAYKKFLELTNGNGFNIPIEATGNSVLLKPKRTQVKSAYSGTVFDTTNWDPFFNKKARKKIEDGL